LCFITQIFFRKIQTLEEAFGTEAMMKPLVCKWREWHDTDGLFCTTTHMQMRRFLAKESIAKHIMTALEHAPYSSGLSPPDFGLHPRPNIIQIRTAIRESRGSH
jgi:hypothetical protein